MTEGELINVNKSTGGVVPISANLRDLGPSNGSCDHGPILIFWHGRWYPKPTRDLSVKMRPFAMPTTQKALQAWQTQPKALCRIGASDLLTQEIETGFS